MLDSTDSTMAEAARRAPDLAQPTWIMAHAQTAARGRRGRIWHSPSGNLNATLLLRPDASPAQAAQRSFLAANALLAALAVYVPQDQLALKWPNDVLLAGGKVAGILLESSGQGGGKVDYLSIGIGVNLAQAPQGVDDAAFAPVCLADHAGAAVPARDFLTHLAAAYAAQEQRLADGGFAAIRADWLARAARLGQVITARTMREQITGTFDGIDAQGNLLLTSAQGAQVITAADIYF